jgi:hypothetical protein
MLKLTDSHYTHAEALFSKGTFSPDASIIYLVYQQMTVGQSKIAAVLLRNAYGHIQFQTSLDTDLKFPTIMGGSSSPDFSMFSLLDTKDDSDMGIARLRILTYNPETNNFDKKLSREFSDYLSGSDSFKGGLFSDDGNTIFVSYLVHKENGKIVTVVRGFDAFSLEAKYAKEIVGVVSSLECFSNFLSIGYSAAQIELNPDDVKIRYEAPATLMIVSMNSHDLPEIESVSLPGVPKFVSILKDNNSKLFSIIIGGDMLVLSNNSKLVIKSMTKTFIENDINNLRVYRFDGKKIDYLYGKNMHQGVRPFFHPNGKFICLTTYTTDYFPDMFSVYQLGNLHNLPLVDTPRVSAPKSQVAFSSDGRWILVSGSGISLNDATIIFNVNLYQFETAVSHYGDYNINDKSSPINDKSSHINDKKDHNRNHHGKNKNNHDKKDHNKNHEKRNLGKDKKKKKTFPPSPKTSSFIETSEEDSNAKNKKMTISYTDFNKKHNKNDNFTKPKKSNRKLSDLYQPVQSNHSFWDNNRSSSSSWEEKMMHKLSRS